MSKQSNSRRSKKSTAFRIGRVRAYAENPFRTIEIGRIPIEDARPIYVFTFEQERTWSKYAGSPVKRPPWRG